MANYFTGEGNYTKLVDEANNLISASNPLEVTTVGGNAPSLAVIGGGVEATALRVTVANDSTGVLTVDNPALSITGGGVELGALRVTIASDSSGTVEVDTKATAAGAFSLTGAAGTSGASLDLGDASATSKDKYDTIMINGVAATAGFKFVLEFSNDGVNWGSDGISPQLTLVAVGEYSFSLTRSKIPARYIRAHIVVQDAATVANYVVAKYN